jgi:hypothetical protein
LLVRKAKQGSEWAFPSLSCRRSSWELMRPGSACDAILHLGHQNH